MTPNLSEEQATGSQNGAEVSSMEVDEPERDNLTNQSILDLMEDSENCSLVVGDKWYFFVSSFGSNELSSLHASYSRYLIDLSWWKTLEGICHKGFLDDVKPLDNTAISLQRSSFLDFFVEKIAEKHVLIEESCSDFFFG